MKRYFHYFFNGHDLGEARSLGALRAIGVKSLRSRPQSHPFYSFDLEESDERNRRAREVGAALNIDYLIQVDAEYCEDELLASPLLTLGIGAAPRGDTFKHTKYAREHGCPQCGTGSPQTSPLILKPSDFPKKGVVASTYYDDELIADQLAQCVFRLIGSTNDLRQVETRKGEKLPWWQIIPECRLPPVHQSTKGLIRGTGRLGAPCTMCKLDGYYGTMSEPLQLVYNRLDFRDLSGWPRAEGKPPPDFARSFEYYGKSSPNPDQPYHERVLANPKIFVSNRIFRLFRDAKVKNLGFTPVTIK